MKLMEQVQQLPVAEKIPKDKLSKSFLDKYNAEMEFAKSRAKIAMEEASKPFE